MSIHNNKSIENIVLKAFEDIASTRLKIEGYIDLDDYIGAKKKEIQERLSVKSKHKVKKNDILLFKEKDVEDFCDDPELVLKWYFNFYLEREVNSKKSLTKRFIEGKCKELINLVYKNNDLDNLPGTLIYYLSGKCEFEKIESLKKFVKLIIKINKRLDTKEFKLYFRGHSNINHRLLPHLYRKDTYLKNEYSLYNQVLTEKPNYFMNDVKNITRLARMQHYGLPTRLLDITINPLVALYFACKSQTRIGEVIIFKEKCEEIKYFNSDLVSILAALSNLKNEEHNSILEYFKDNLKCKFSPKKFNMKKEIQKLSYIISNECFGFKPKITPGDLLKCAFVNSILNNDRIKMQEGSFIICGLDKNDSILNFLNRKRLKNDNNSKKVILYILEKDKRPILTELAMFSLKESRLFPELDYFCNEIKERE